MNYTLLSNENINDMLSDIGVESTEDLFNDIPDNIRIDSLNIPVGKTEYEVEQQICNILSKNKKMTLFAGYGVYNHYVPSIIDFITTRSEFFTAYTPYQPELSQGTLKAIFEYQTNISRLMGMDIANASLYDGGSAVAESIVMAVKSNKKKHKKSVILSNTLNPKYKKVVETYLKYQKSIEIVYTNDIFKTDSVSDNMVEESYCIVVQYPNVYGVIEDYRTLIENAHKHNCYVILVTYPMVCGLLKTPGELKADIACGEAQCFGNYLNGGGSYLGYIAVTKKLMRKMPGRLVGKTTDKNGLNAYVLTLQAREQHIRREKATSNICSNQSLNAIRANIYLSLLGYKGLKKIGKQIYNSAHYLYDRIKDVNKDIIVLQNEFFFNEFLINVDDIDSFISYMDKEYMICPGVKVAVDNKEYLLVSVTEMITKQNIEDYIQGLNITMTRTK